jgi:hypothetical protein
VARRSAFLLAGAPDGDEEGRLVPALLIEF